MWKINYLTLKNIMSLSKWTALAFLIVLFAFIFLSSISTAQQNYSSPQFPASPLPSTKPSPLIPFGLEDVSISSVVWNGKYWLIGTTQGDIVRYDGREFSYIKNLGSHVSHIAWSGNHWLISIGKGLQKDKGLVKFDGEKFVTLSKDYSPQVIACAAYCLMWGSPWDMRFMRYDGELNDITSQFREIAGNEYVSNIIWNGEYWLIVTTKVLVRYDGKTFSKIDFGIEQEKMYIYSAGWNRVYWLISAGDRINGYIPRIFKYDGELENVEVPAFFNVPSLKEKYEAAGFPVPTTYIVPFDIKWNGEYWLSPALIFPILIKYDGKNFESIALPQNAFNVKETFWDKNYWLISYTVVPRGWRLAKYDGREMEELDINFKVLEYLVWGNEYWLISGKDENDALKFVKYDGQTFTDLTPELKSALPVSRSKRLIYVAAILVVVGITFLIWKKRKAS